MTGYFCSCLYSTVLGLLPPPFPYINPVPSPNLQENEEYGELLLSLNYLPTAGRLNVDVIKAKQILQTSLVRGAGQSRIASIQCFQH